MVQRPAGEADVARREAELGDVGVVLPRQIGVGEHDALRASGRPGGVHQAMDVVPPTAARSGMARLETGERLPAVDAMVGRHAEAGRSGSEPVDRVVGEVDERLVTHQHLGPRMLEQVPQLGGGETPVDGHRHRAEGVGGEDRGEELRAVVRQQPHDITECRRPVPAVLLPTEPTTRPCPGTSRSHRHKRRLPCRECVRRGARARRTQLRSADDAGEAGMAARLFVRLVVTRI